MQLVHKGSEGATRVFSMLTQLIQIKLMVLSEVF